jgi:hypothetical protein
MARPSANLIAATTGLGPPSCRPPNASDSSATTASTVEIDATQPSMKAGVEVRARGDISSTTIAMIGSGLIETATASGRSSPMACCCMVRAPATGPNGMPGPLPEALDQGPIPALESCR